MNKGKDAILRSAFIAAEAVREKCKRSNQKIPLDEVEKNIAIITTLLMEEKISKTEYDVKLQKILNSM